MTTPWLSDTEREAWRTFFDCAKQLVDALDRQLQDSAELPLAYYEIMVRLADAQDRALRMSELADATRYSPSRLTHAVNRLEERGWVRRTRMPDDRRGSRAHLTDAGFTVLADAAPGHVAAVRRYLVDPLSSEQLQQLTAIGQRVLAALGEAAPPGSPRGS